ncbi:MAG: nucleotidyltransferase domain-containing protein [Butyrivibrio sp.]|nr:nucleotidyltransferase domain-containing protein [Butyrivibrio sp.]
MNSVADMEKLYKDIYRSMVIIFGKNMDRVVLYGSYARGDFDEESDIDIAVIANETDQELQKHHKAMVKESSRFMREYDKLVSIHSIPLERFNRFKNAYPYYQNIEKEGITLNA